MHVHCGPWYHDLLLSVGMTVFSRPFFFTTFGFQIRTSETSDISLWVYVHVPCGPWYHDHIRCDYSFRAVFLRQDHRSFCDTSRHSSFAMSNWSDEGWSNDTCWTSWRGWWNASDWRGNSEGWGNRDPWQAGSAAVVSRSSETAAAQWLTTTEMPKAKAQPPKPPGVHDGVSIPEQASPGLGGSAHVDTSPPAPSMPMSAPKNLPGVPLPKSPPKPEPRAKVADSPPPGLDDTCTPLLEVVEPVDHKDPEVVEQFQRFFGVTMTFEQVMTLFAKGEAPAAIVQSGKVMAFDSLLYSYDDFTRFYGTAAGANEWNFAKRVHQDLLLALHELQNITNFLRVYAEVHPQVQIMRDSVFTLLFDPTRPWQHGDEPPVIAIMRMFLRPLWVRRRRLEQLHGALHRFSEELAPEDLGSIFNEWQHAWYNSDEVTVQHRSQNTLRAAWFAHLKQRCGGAVLAKLLIQYGPDRISDLLPAVLDARADRPTEQAPIMQVARAAMQQRATM